MISHKELAVSSNHLILVIVLSGSPPVPPSPPPTQVGSVLGLEPKTGLELAAGLGEFKTLRSRVGCLAGATQALLPASDGLESCLSFIASLFCLVFLLLFVISLYQMQLDRSGVCKDFFLHRYQFSRHSDL